MYGHCVLGSSRPPYYVSRTSAVVSRRWQIVVVVLVRVVIRWNFRRIHVAYLLRSSISLYRWRAESVNASTYITRRTTFVYKRNVTVITRSFRRFTSSRARTLYNTLVRVSLRLYWVVCCARARLKITRVLRVRSNRRHKTKTQRSRIWTNRRVPTNGNVFSTIRPWTRTNRIRNRP